MGWFSKSLKGIIDPRAAGESIIERQEANYRDLAQKNPGAAPHYILSLVYLARMMTHGKNPRSEDIQSESLAMTREFACLPFPDNVQALGIALIQMERPDILEQCPDLEMKFLELMAPVHEARLSASFDELYGRRNPTMAGPRTRGGREI